MKECYICHAKKPTFAEGWIARPSKYIGSPEFFFVCPECWPQYEPLLAWQSERKRLLEEALITLKELPGSEIFEMSVTDAVGQRYDYDWTLALTSEEAAEKVEAFCGDALLMRYHAESTNRYVLDPEFRRRSSTWLSLDEASSRAVKLTKFHEPRGGYFSSRMMEIQPGTHWQEIVLARSVEDYHIGIYSGPRWIQELD